MTLPNDYGVVLLTLERREAEDMAGYWRMRLDMIGAAENQWLIDHGHEPTFIRLDILDSLRKWSSAFAASAHATWRDSRSDSPTETGTGEG